MKKLVKGFFGLGILSLALTGCGCGQEEAVLQVGETVYTPFLSETVAMELPDSVRSASSWINGYILEGERLVFNMYQMDLLAYDGNDLQFYQRSYEIPLEGLFAGEPWVQNKGIFVPAEVMKELSVPEEIYHSGGAGAEFIHRFVQGQDGHIYYLTGVKTDEEYLGTVYKCAPDTGACVDKWELTGVPETVAVGTISENTLHEVGMQVDEKDTLYLMDSSSAVLYVLPRSGEEKDKVTLPKGCVKDFQWNPKGELEFVVLNERGTGSVYYLDVKKLRYEEVTEVSEENVQAIGRNELGKLCYYTGTELFFLNEEGQKESFLNYEKGIVKPEDLLSFMVVDDSVIYLNGSRKLIKHTKAEAYQGAEKQVITLGYAGLLSDEFSQYVIGFNKGSLYYEVQLKEYGTENGHERLLADLSSGHGPDIFFTDIALVREFVKNGWIEDLTPYLQDGKGLEREHFVESVLRANTYEEVLYTIPRNFAIDLLLGMRKNFEDVDAMHWTVSDYMEIVEGCGGMEVLGGKYMADTEEGGRLLITMPVLEGNLDYYADEEQGVAHFAEEEFVQLLELAKDYPFGNFGNNGFETKKKLLEGDLLLENWMISNVQTFLENRAILGTEEIYLSYPSVDGEGGYGVVNFDSMSISAGSTQKEAAWAFMEYVLNARGGRQSVTGEYFSSKQKTFDYQLECATVKQYQYDTNGIGYLQDKKGNPIEKPRYSGESFGVTYEVYAATDEELQLLRELVEGISFSTDLRNDVLRGIAMEEIGDMVAGVNDVEGTVHNLQTRVGLYLEERK